MHVGKWSCILCLSQNLQNFRPARWTCHSCCAANLIIFSSCVKKFPTRKYFKFHDVKKNKTKQNDRTNRTAEKISCLQKIHLYYYYYYY